MLSLEKLDALLRELCPGRTVYCALDQREQIQEAVDALNVPRVTVFGSSLIDHGVCYVVKMGLVSDPWWPSSGLYPVDVTADIAAEHAADSALRVKNPFRTRLA